MAGTSPKLEHLRGHPCGTSDQLEMSTINQRSSVSRTLPGRSLVGQIPQAEDSRDRFGLAECGWERQSSSRPYAEPVPYVRQARESDVGRIHSLIVELATYERSADQVRATPDQLRARALRRAAGGIRPGGRRLGTTSSASRSTSGTSPPGRACMASIWRTCTSSRSTAVGVTARPCSAHWLHWPSSAGTPGWSGLCWIGISLPSTSTAASAPCPWMSGPSTDSAVIRYSR